MAEDIKKEDIAHLGKFGLIQKITSGFELHNKSSLTGIGEDAAAIKPAKKNSLFSSKLFLENIHFDLTYFPLKHLGYKVIAVAISDILGANGVPTQISLNLAVSNRFSIQAIEEFMLGVRIACDRYKIDLIDFDITSSQTGLTISVGAIGEVDPKNLVKHSGAKINDLICVSGDLGSAYTGLILLEREKKVFEVNPDMQPDFAGYDYLLERQLKPEAKTEVVQLLEKEGIVPTAMSVVADGLATSLIHLCHASGTGCSIFEEKLPIDTLTFETLKELKIVATTIALNGGEDYELLFTVSQNDYDKINTMKDISVIGYMTEKNAGMNITTNDNRQFSIQAQGFGGSFIRKRDFLVEEQVSSSS